MILRKDLLPVSVMLFRVVTIVLVVILCKDIPDVENVRLHRVVTTFEVDRDGDIAVAYLSQDFHMMGYFRHEVFVLIFEMLFCRVHHGVPILTEIIFYDGKDHN